MTVSCKLNGHPDLALAESSRGLALSPVIALKKAMCGALLYVAFALNPDAYLQLSPRRNHTSTQLSLPQLAD